jgi:hypothetical protein
VDRGRGHVRKIDSRHEGRLTPLYGSTKMESEFSAETKVIDNTVNKYVSSVGRGGIAPQKHTAQCRQGCEVSRCDKCSISYGSDRAPTSLMSA